MNENIICRLCLDVVPVGYTVFKENIQSTIRSLTSIDVSEHDNLPKLSCSKCILNLYFVESIGKLIIESDERLRSLFNRDGNFNEIFNSYKDKYIESTLTLTPEDENYSNIEIKEESEIIFESEATEDPPKPKVESVDTSEQNHSENEKKITKSVRVNDIDSIISKKSDKKPYLYHCNVCDVDFHGNKIYAKHKGMHLKKTCEICGVTTRQDNFIKHMQKHKLGQQICDICGSIHKSLEGLRTHLFHFHNAKKKLYKCAECGETFKYSNRLTYHRNKIHTGFRPHQCDTCGKRFRDLSTMKKHIKLIHLKLREYPCKYCKKDYSSGYALKVHTRQHTDETPYVCEICSEGFRQLVSLKTHLAKHDKSEKPSTSHTDADEEDDDSAKEQSS